jgi:hypothetical protein
MIKEWWHIYWIIINLVYKFQLKFLYFINIYFIIMNNDWWFIDEYKINKTTLPYDDTGTTFIYSYFVQEIGLEIVWLFWS